MEGLEISPRLGVHDKRHLFQSLLAMAERLLYLNKFPVDQPDFALSLQSPEIEAAWLLINQAPTNNSLAPVTDTYFMCNDIKWRMHMYGEDKPAKFNHNWNRVFMNVQKTLDVDLARRHLGVVKVWCDQQARLEAQVLRAAKCIKAIVHACNTVGQYKRVSPDLLGFLPERYQLALKDYTKQSPYPEISVTKEEIDTMLSSLAFAALQPQHHSEEDYSDRKSWHSAQYRLELFARSHSYDGNSVRTLNL